MIVGTPLTVSGHERSASHGGEGSYFVRTLIEDIPSSAFKYVRDLTLYPGSSVGLHPHSGDDEVFFIMSGTGVMTVDGQERELGPGSAVLTLAGSAHGLRNTGTENLRVFVACARIG